MTKKELNLKSHFYGLSIYGKVSKLPHLFFGSNMIVDFCSGAREHTPVSVACSPISEGNFKPCFKILL